MAICISAQQMTCDAGWLNIIMANRGLRNPARLLNYVIMSRILRSPMLGKENLDSKKMGALLHNSRKGFRPACYKKVGVGDNKRPIFRVSSSRQ